MTKTRKKILTTGLLSTISAVALAGGGLNMASPTNFTGFFGGAQMGVHSGNMHTNSVSDGFFLGDTDKITSDITNVAAGIFAGYGQQFNNNIYLGVSGDLNWVNSQITEDLDIYFLGAKVEDLKNVRKISPTYSANAELGYVVNQKVLLFITGGYAGAHVDNDSTETIVSSGAATSQDNHVNSNGYNIGLGMRAMLTKNIFVQGKGTYTSLGKVETKYTNFNAEFKPKYYQILFGVGYKI
jgi:opacity protein-like surface antigen